MSYQRQDVNIGVAYLLWGLCVFGICGIHRFYLGRIGTGLLYLFTFGLFGFGQVIDLFLIPDMAQQRNRYLWEKLRTDKLLQYADRGEEFIRNKTAKILQQVQKNLETSPSQTNHSDPMLLLLKAAAAHNNVLSLGQAMIATELPADTLEKLLKQALKQGIAHIDNDPETGAVRYHFDI
jgi:TM2 domain-containing membrane protein YozV